MTEIKKLGIDLIKKAIDTGIGTAIEIQDDLSDGKMQTMEIIALSDNLFSIAKQGMNWKELVGQIKDADAKERSELLQHIANKGILPEKAEKVLEHVVAWLEVQVKAYNEHIKPIIEIFKSE